MEDRKKTSVVIYQKKYFFWNRICLIFLCVRLRNKIFYSTEKNIFSCF